MSQVDHCRCDVCGKKADKPQNGWATLRINEPPGQRSDRVDICSECWSRVRRESPSFNTALNRTVDL